MVNFDYCNYSNIFFKYHGSVGDSLCIQSKAGFPGMKDTSVIAA